MSDAGAIRSLNLFCDAEGVRNDSVLDSLQEKVESLELRVTLNEEALVDSVKFRLLFLWLNLGDSASSLKAERE